MPILLLRVNSTCHLLWSFGFVGFPYPVQPEKFSVEPGRISFITIRTVITVKLRVYHRSRALNMAIPGTALVIAEETISGYNNSGIEPVVGKPDTLEYMYGHTFITFGLPYLFDPFPHP